MIGGQNHAELLPAVVYGETAEEALTRAVDMARQTYPAAEPPGE